MWQWSLVISVVRASLPVFTKTTPTLALQASFAKLPPKKISITTFILFIMLLAKPAWAEGGPTVLRISVQEGFNDLPPIAQLQEFYKKALARENIKPHFLALPLARSAQLADNGEIDGEMIRSLNIIEKYPNLIATSKPIGFSNFLILYAKSNRSFKEKKLPQYKGLIILNSFTTRQKARDMRLRLDTVPTIDQGLSMVVAGRADYIILAEPIIDSLPRSLKPLMDQLKTVKEPFSRLPLYFILNKKHKDLMPKLEKALFKTMSTEGHNYRYLKDFLNTGA